MFLNTVRNYIRMSVKLAFWGTLVFLVMSRNLSAQNFNENFMVQTKSEIKRRFPEVPSITVEDLKNRLIESENLRPMIIDVRDSEEFAVSHLDGAISYPLDQAIREKNFDLPHDRMLLVYCSVGYRSAKFVRHLRNNGYVNVYNLEGGIFEWKNTGNSVYRDGVKVKLVHPYNAKWGRLLDPKCHWPGARS